MAALFLLILRHIQTVTQSDTLLLNVNIKIYSTCFLSSFFTHVFLSYRGSEAGKGEIHSTIYFKNRSCSIFDDTL